MEYAEDCVFCERDIIGVGICLCEVLQYLHTQVPPVIHRDIKPQNIVLKEDGTVWLIDFGISRVYKEEEEADTVFCGTKDYAAPEQYGYMQTGIYSDIYSLGIVLTWMLTEKTAPIQKPVTPLEKILAKCTAFAPESRFQDAAELEKELKFLILGRTKKEKSRKKTVILSVLAVIAVLVCVFGILWYKTVIRFEEPLVEEAVRKVLQKPEGKLTGEDLQKITEIYIVGNRTCISSEEHFAVREEWFQAGNIRGAVTTLKDLGKMPNLRTVYIFGEHIADISPLKELTELCKVDLGFNDISDISALEGKQKLTFIGFNSNPLTDISVLASCPILTEVDLREAGSGYSGQVFAQMGDFNFLDIANGSDAYRYLDGKRIDVLKVGGSDQYDLECIRNITVRELTICYSKIADISALEGRTDIVYLDMDGCYIDDLSVLLTMPNLNRVVLRADMKRAMTRVCKEPDFMVEYGE